MGYIYGTLRVDVRAGLRWIVDNERLSYSRKGYEKMVERFDDDALISTAMIENELRAFQFFSIYSESCSFSVDSDQDTSIAFKNALGNTVTHIYEQGHKCLMIGVDRNNTLQVYYGALNDCVKGFARNQQDESIGGTLGPVIVLKKY